MMLTEIVRRLFWRHTQSVSKSRLKSKGSCKYREEVVASSLIGQARYRYSVCLPFSISTLATKLPTTRPGSSQPRHKTEVLLPLGSKIFTNNNANTIVASLASHLASATTHNMDNANALLPEDSLVTAIIEVWDVVFPILIVATTFIPAVLLLIGAAFFAIRLSDIRKDKDLVFFAFILIGVMSHVVGLIFGLAPEFGRHKGWLMICFQAYLGEIMLHAFAVGIIAVVVSGWRAYQVRMRGGRGVRI